MSGKTNSKVFSAGELTTHIEQCALNSRESQKEIYNSFYGYAMAVCAPYTKNPDDATEIVNDGFLKIFKDIHRYKPAYVDAVGSFKGWLRRIMAYTAIDHFRKNRKYQFSTDFDDEMNWLPANDEDLLDRLSYEEIIKAVQNLTSGYQAVFNLFVIEGLSHEEVSEKLGISIGTSKSNLSKARKRLQQILFQQNRAHPLKNAV